MCGFVPNLLISQPEHFPRCDFRDCCCSVGHVDIFSSLSPLKTGKPGKIQPACALRMLGLLDVMAPLLGPGVLYGANAVRFF